MKTKKTAKILSVVLTLAILVCSLSVISGFVTTAETNSEESKLIDNLKTEWGKLSKVEDIAELNTEDLGQNQIIDQARNPATIGIEFKNDNTFNKTTYDGGAAVGGSYYIYGLVFSKKDSGVFFNSKTDNSFNEIFSDDSLYFTLNPGTVTAAGRMWVILQYNGDGSRNVLYGTVEIAANDSTAKKIVIKDLEFKCGYNTGNGDPNTYKFNTLSDALQYRNSNGEDKDLFTIKVMFNPGLATTGASISELKTVKSETLPAKNEEFTALDWYNAAKKLDVNGYENAAAFTTALNNLKTYLTENDPNFLVSELKNAWQSLYTNKEIAYFPITSPVITSQQDDANIYTTDGYAQKFTFNADNGTFSKTPNPNNTTTYLRGIVFKLLNNDKVFTKGSNSTNNAFNNAFNNDSLYFTFNPGTVNADGNLLVLLQYSNYGGTYVLYAEVPVKLGDTAEDKKIEIEKFTYKCADKTNYPNNSYTFTKPSDMLISPVNGSELHTIKIMFDGTASVSNAKVSSLQGVKYATLPEGNGSFKPLDWYNAAKKLDVNGYENAAAFTTALNNLETYLSKNDPDFLVSELKESWGKLSRDVSIAELNTDYLVSMTYAPDKNSTPATIGMTFNNNTFVKTEYEYSAVGGEYQKLGLVFSKNDSSGNKKIFDSNINDTDNNSFDNAFRDNSLYFTFNPGEVEAAGEMYVILQYNGNTGKDILYATVSINDKTEQKIVINELEFKNYDKTSVVSHTNLSDLLTYTNTNGEFKELFTIKVMFNRTFVTKGASISELKTVKRETLPGDTDSNELILGKSFRVNTASYDDIGKDFSEKRDNLYEKLIAGKTVGNVNDIDDVDICDLVALNELNDETYKLVADMDKDGYITEADKTMLRSKILNQ